MSDCKDMRYQILAQDPDGSVIVHLFASQGHRDYLHRSMRFFGGPVRLATSNRATMEDACKHAERHWEATSVQVRHYP